MFAECLVLVVLSTFTLTLANDDPSLRFRGHVLKTNGKYEIVTALADSYQEPDMNTDNVVVTGFWDQSYNTTGWSILEIKTLENQTNIDQAYGAGLLEGKLTRELTNMQWQNAIADICPDQTTDLCKKLKEFFLIQLDWIYSQIDSFPNEEYWHQVNLLLVQLNGLIDGHDNNQRGARREIDDPFGFFLFQVVESIGELSARFGYENIARHDSCSALIKILPGNKDIFISHADWSNYRTMLKVIKRYIMPLKRTSAPDSTLIPSTHTIFSSYPGTLHSVDDFYMTYPANMTIIETTIENNNPDLFHNILPISVPEWIRIVVANRLANSGVDWVEKFFVFNDGTYNNEWMIADYKQFTPGTPPKPGFLTVAEQMITYYQSKDMTETLNNNSYWASYNNVYFPDFRNISGEADKEKVLPELYSWQNSARAKIFQHNHGNVTDLPSMQRMMRYNDFKNDPLSKCNCTPPYSAELTIAARCDLNIPKPSGGIYPDEVLGYRVHGETDAKITNYDMMQKFLLSAVAGPTTDQQPPFVWSTSGFQNISHIGHPDIWNFTWITPTWVLS